MPVLPHAAPVWDVPRTGMRDTGQVSEALRCSDEQRGAEGSWGPTVRGPQHHSLPPPGVLGPSSSCDCDSPSGGGQLPGLGWAGWGCKLVLCCPGVDARVPAALSPLPSLGFWHPRKRSLYFDFYIRYWLVLAVPLPGPSLPFPMCVHPSLLLCRGAVTPQRGRAALPHASPFPALEGTTPCLLV